MFHDRPAPVESERGNSNERPSIAGPSEGPTDRRAWAQDDLVLGAPSRHLELQPWAVIRPRGLLASEGFRCL